MTRYRLLREYPNHKIGDIAILSKLNTTCPNNFHWEKDSDNTIPGLFWPSTCPDWWQKIEEEKSLKDYEKQIDLPLPLAFKLDYPRIYWTEVLQVIAKDLNKDKTVDEYKYHILRTNDRVWTSTVSEPHSRPGLISFIRKEDCQKAIDLLGENIKFLFDE